MGYRIKMRDDGILHTSFHGDVTTEEMEAFRREFLVYLNAATEEEPLLVISESPGLTKFSAGARRILVELQRSPRLGNSAVVGASRYSRVLTTFVLKATGRNNIRFFDTIEEAAAWLKEGKQE